MDITLTIHYPDDWASRPSGEEDPGHFLVFMIPKRQRFPLPQEQHDAKEKGRKGFDIPPDYCSQELVTTEYQFRSEIPTYFKSHKVTNEGMELKLFKEDLALLLRWNSFQENLKDFRRSFIEKTIKEYTPASGVAM